MKDKEKLYNRQEKFKSKPQVYMFRLVDEESVCLLNFRVNLNYSEKVFWLRNKQKPQL